MLAPSDALQDRIDIEWKNLPRGNYNFEFCKQYFQELNEIPERLTVARELVRKLTANTNVLLVCVCPEPAYCHRTELATYLFLQSGFDSKELTVDDIII